MKLPILPCFLAAAISFAGVAVSADGVLSNYNEALKQASELKRPIVLEFTGSDWCPPCKMMKSETFSKPAFKEFAEKDVVFVELDFPQGKKLPAETVKQNEKLASQFGVEGFPTFLVLDSAGRELARHVGFLPGGPDAFIAWVKSKTGN